MTFNNVKFNLPIGLPLCEAVQSILQDLKGIYIPFQNTIISKKTNKEPDIVKGSCGERLFIFRELESTANYFRGAEEQAHTLGIKGALSKVKKKI